MTFSSIPAYDATTPGNNTDIGGVSIAEGWPATNINNSIRQLLTQLKQYLANSATVASASTVDLGAQTANYVTISGSTTVTSFGTIAAGTWRMIRFSGAVPITYNATSMILPGGASITAAAGDTALFVSEGSGNWRCLDYVRASGLPIVNPTIAPSPASINGLLPTSVAGTSTTASLTVSAGTAADSTNAALLTLGSQAWAVSNGNAINGYAGGTTLPNSSSIHFFVCQGGSGIGTFASTSLSPTFPTGYTTYNRRIFSLRTNSSGAFLMNGATAFEINGGGVKLLYGTTPAAIISATTVPTTATLYDTLAPAGLNFESILLLNMTGTAATAASILFSSPASPNDDPATGPVTIKTGTGAVATVQAEQIQLTTDTSGQVRGRSTGTSGYTLSMFTSGYIDYRRS